jgi:ribosomal protein S18 acetylase RimI-like enzyme
MLVVEPALDTDVANIVKLASRELRVDAASWPARHHSCCLVARDIPTNHIVGFALADREDPCIGHILAIAVEGDHRGRGIGSALLSRVRQQMTQEGAMELVLDVRGDNQGAQEFYGRHGFRPEGRVSQAYPDGEDAIHLVRPI